MARKNLLKGLMEQGQDSAKPPSDPPAPRYKKGAIGAVSKQIEELKSRAVVEMDPFKIKASGLQDRIEHDEAAHQTLMRSIQDHGQQVPILVRPDPDDDEGYLIVYGRRRVLALRDLGMPVKAMIRDLDEAEAIMAQGQENSARKDLSFIERVNFARQMVDASYDRKAICDALSTDKTLISRMLKISETIPVEVIEMIGAAHGIGRDRWLQFAEHWSRQELMASDATDMLAVLPAKSSDERFQALMAWLETRSGDVAAKPNAAPKQVKLPKQPIHGPSGKMGQITVSGDKTRIELSARKAEGFDHWLANNIEEILQQYLKEKAGE